MKKKTGSGSGSSLSSSSLFSSSTPTTPTIITTSPQSSSTDLSSSSSSCLNSSLSSSPPSSEPTSPSLSSFDSSNQPYQSGEIVLAYHQNLLYEAKLLKMKVDSEKSQKLGRPVHLFYIHYQGWKDRWNEWVAEDRVMKVNAESLQLQNKINEEYRKSRPHQSATGPGSSSGSSRFLPKPSEPTPAKRRRSDRKIPTHEVNIASASQKFRVDFPEELKSVLLRDHEFIVEKKKLLQLPRSPSLSQILSDYAQKNFDSTGLRYSQEEEENWNEMLQGIQHYFDETVHLLLLYKSEKKQYTDYFQSSGSGSGSGNASSGSRRTSSSSSLNKKEREREREKEREKEKEREREAKYVPSNVYGFEHLLRLLVKVPELFARTEMEEEAIVIIKSQIIDLLIYLQQNIPTWHNERNYI